jgi:hypothetical protein
VELRAGRLEIPVGTGPRSAAIRWVFGERPLSANVALVGYEARYTSSDHHVRRLLVQLYAQVGARVDDGWEVLVTGWMELRDQNSDDPFTGWIDYLLFVELAAPPPVVVVGVDIVSAPLS